MPLLQGPAHCYSAHNWRVRHTLSEICQREGWTVRISWKLNCSKGSWGLSLITSLVFEKTEYLNFPNTQVCVSPPVLSLCPHFLGLMTLLCLSNVQNMKVQVPGRAYGIGTAVGGPCLPISPVFPRQAFTIGSLVWNALGLSLGILQL